VTTNNETKPQSRLRHGVAEEVRVLLARRRLSATKLAKQLGWTQQYLSRRMVGEQPFDLDDLEQIAAALDVGIVDLLPRDRRQQVTGWYPSTPGLTVSGTVPHPRHPIVAGAVPLGEIRHGDARRERRIGRTAERITSMSFAATA